MLEIDKDGNRFWRNNKHQLHKVNGPAVEWNNGGKQWYIDGELHRSDGPAVEYADGYRWLCLNGVKYTEEEYREKAKEYVGY